MHLWVKRALLASIEATVSDTAIRGELLLMHSTSLQPLPCSIPSQCSCMSPTPFDRLIHGPQTKKLCKLIRPLYCMQCLLLLVYCSPRSLCAATFPRRRRFCRYSQHSVGPTFPATTEISGLMLTGTASCPTIFE